MTAARSANSARALVTSSATGRAAAIPAVVLGAHLGGLGVIRALAAVDVPVIAVSHSKDEFGQVSRRVARALESPDPARAEREFLDFLLDLGEQAPGSVLMPTSDEALIVVARNRAALQRCFRVGCTDWEVAERFIDKRRTYALAEAIGVPAPRTANPGGVDDLERCAEAVGYPCVVKPRQSHLYQSRFRCKLVKAGTFPQLIEAWEDATRAGLGTVIQEFIPGPDSNGANYNAYVVAGRPVVECTAEKVRLYPPESGSPRVVRSRYVPEAVRAGRKVLQGMGIDGFACTEFKRDARDGVLKLMEVNGRHNRSTLLSVRAGVNFPWIMYRHLVAGRLPARVSWRSGVYWIDLFSDMTQSIKHARTEDYSWRDYLRPYFRPKVFAALEATDPAPFARQLAERARVFAAQRLSLG